MEIISKPLWEILVPYTMGHHDGSDPNKPKRNRTVPVPYHQEWDAKVRDITGGMTIMKVAQGQWEDKDGRLYRELMIPVRVACTREQIDEIAKLTLEWYAQKAVFVTLVSESAIVYYADGQQPEPEESEREAVVGYAFYYPSVAQIGGYTTDLSDENILYILREDPGTEFRPLYERDFKRNEAEVESGAAEDTGNWSPEHEKEIIAREEIVYEVRKELVRK